MGMVAPDLTDPAAGLFYVNHNGYLRAVLFGMDYDPVQPPADAEPLPPLVENMQLVGGGVALWGFAFIAGRIFDQCWGRMGHWPAFLTAAAGPAGQAAGGFFDELAAPAARPLMRELYRLCMSLYDPAHLTHPIAYPFMADENNWHAFDLAVFDAIPHQPAAAAAPNTNQPAPIIESEDED